MNCDAEIKNGFLKSNEQLSDMAVNFINDKLNLNAKFYCNSCGDNLYKKAKITFEKSQKAECKHCHKSINISDKKMAIVMNTQILYLGKKAYD